MSQPKQFGRIYELQVDTLVVSGLRVTFKVTKDDKPEPNKCEVSIYNLSAESRAKCQKVNSALILKAGYEEAGLTVMFSGTVSKVSHVREGADWVTKIISGDGEYPWRTVRVSESFAPGATIETVTKALINKLGLKEGNALSEIAKGGFARGVQDFAHGKSIVGLGSKELVRLMKSVGYNISIQDGAVQILKPGSSNGQTPSVDAATGLIGSPEFGETGEGPSKTLTLKATVLLKPQIIPGSKLELKSVSKNGFFFVNKVIHEGDNFGGPWYSKLELSQLNQTTNLGNLTPTIA